MPKNVDVSRDCSERVRLSLQDASVRLSIAVPTLRRWLRQGRLSYVRCGRALRIEVAEVTRFIEAHRRPASDDRNVGPE
jgi:excisionase family DNA binding protein